MNCQTIRQHWNAFHDSECDERALSLVSTHLDSCKDCADWFRQQSDLEDRMTAGLCEPDHSLASTAVCFPPQRQQRRPRRIAVLVGVAAIAILVITVLFQEKRSSPRGSLLLLSATIHRNLANGSLIPGLQSESDLEVEEYFQSRAPFPVRCPPRIDSGFSVTGAGLCDLGGHPAAVVIGSVEKEGSTETTPVSLIVMAKDRISNFSEHTRALKNNSHVECSDGELNIVIATYDQNLILAAGATDWKNLQRLLDAYGSYPH